MASRMERYSSSTVGKNLNTTAKGMITFCGRRSRSNAATNSLTVVVANR